METQRKKLDWLGQTSGEVNIFKANDNWLEKKPGKYHEMRQCMS